MNNAVVDMAQVGVYWREVGRIENQLHREMLENRHPHQPKPTVHIDPITGATVNAVDHVFITSLRNVTQRTTAGTTCGATVRLAAQKIAEGTHRLSTAEELEAFHERQRQQREFHEAEEERHSKVRTFKVNFPTGEQK